MNKLKYFIFILAALTILLLTAYGLVRAGVLTPPQVLARQPAPGSHNVDVGSSVSITYDQNMDPATVDPQSFAVHARQTGRLTETLSVISGTITLDPLNPFHAGELVQVSATTATLSLGGEAPLAPTVWQFNTAPWGGNATFHEHQVFNNISSRDAALGDLDGDGDLDAIAVCLQGSTLVYHNDGSGIFTQVQSISHYTYKFLDAELGDLDGDGDLDAVLVDYSNPGSNIILLNDGTGYFTQSSTTIPSQDDTYGELGDLDGDGDLDLIVASGGFGAGTIRVWKNDGAGNFTLAQDFDSAYEHVDVALGDLNGDGYLDAFTTGGNNTYNKVWLNDGTGNFSEAQAIPNANTYGVQLGDLDGDGDLDAYLAGTAFNLTDLPDQVWFNDGTGHFTDSGQRLETVFSAMPALGDLDADGDLDVYLSGDDSGSLSDEVWANDGTGVFTLFRTVDENYQGGLVTLGDLDGDGNLDAFTTSPFANPGYQIYLNGDWTQAVPIPYPWAGHGIQCPGDPEHYYLVGGLTTGWLDINTVSRYDVLDGSWHSLASLPIENRAPSLACYQGKIYAAGGLNPVQGLLDMLYIYDIASDSWSPGADLPNVNVGAALAAWDGKLYLVGGNAIGEPWVPLADVHVYDIASNTWITNGGADMLVASNFYGSAQAGPYLYVVGGLSGNYNNNLLATQCYNMASNTWEQGPFFTSRRALTALAITGGSLYAVGGDANGGGSWYNLTDDVERLDLSLWPGGTWTDIKDPLPETRITQSFCSESLAGGEIWAVGGFAISSQPDESMYYYPAEPCLGSTFAFSLNPESQADSGLPGEEIIYPIIITNTGGIPDAYQVGVESEWDTRVLAIEPLWPGESVEVQITVDIPAGALAGEQDTAEITVTSQGDAEQVGEATLTTTALAFYRVDLAAEIPALSGLPGEVVTYTLHLTNLGNITDTIDLSSSGNLWEVTLPITSVVLAAGESVDVTVYVTVAGDALADAHDMVTLTATSQGDPAQTDADTLTTTALPVHGVALVHDSALAGFPGKVVIYTLHLTNTGNITDTFEVSFAGNLWEVTLPVTSTMLAAGESVDVIVTVTVPVAVLPGSQDWVTILAASQGDPLQFAQVELTTTAVYQAVFLPVIHK